MFNDRGDSNIVFWIGAVLVAAVLILALVAGRVIAEALAGLIR